MKIALVTKLWEATSPRASGGTAFIVGSLADSLVARGHEVTLYASGDSDTKAKLVSVTAKHNSDRYLESASYLTIGRAFQAASNYDIIDCHVEEKALFFSPLVRTPVIYTIGFGEFSHEEKKVLNEYKNQKFLSISRAVRKVAPGLNWIATVYNGIRVADFPFSDHPGDYLLLLGRVSPQKGVHHAVKLALRSGLKLFVAGKINPDDRDYLDRVFWPYVDNKNIIYLGLLGYQEKMPFLKNALALINPICYLEAFGLNMVEAMACGTPVLAFNRGAVEEVVQDGETGFIVPPNNVAQMLKALQRVRQIDRARCRNWVKNNFSLDRMVKGYEKVYREVTKQGLTLS